MSMFLKPKEIVVAVRKAGVSKVNMPIGAMLMMGILAGAYIGFGAHLATTISTGSAEFIGFGMAKFIAGTVFSLGLVLVVLTGAELFTGNSLLSIAFFDKKITFKGLLTNWSVVYIANLIGSLLLAWLIYSAGSNGINGELTKVGETAVQIATAKATLPLMQVFFRAILANWLVCLAIFLAVAAQDVTSKILACFFPIMAFVAMGFEHSIANMYFLPAGILAAQGSVASLTVANASANIITATIGNVVGGVLFVGAIYWGVFLKNQKDTIK